jgi:hypothetical protein
MKCSVENEADSELDEEESSFGSAEVSPFELKEVVGVSGSFPLSGLEESSFELGFEPWRFDMFELMGRI